MSDCVCASVGRRGALCTMLHSQAPQGAVPPQCLRYHQWVMDGRVPKFFGRKGGAGDNYLDASVGGEGTLGLASRSARGRAAWSLTPSWPFWAPAWLWGGWFPGSLTPGSPGSIRLCVGTHRGHAWRGGLNLIVYSPSFSSECNRARPPTLALGWGPEMMVRVMSTAPTSTPALGISPGRCARRCLGHLEGPTKYKRPYAGSLWADST